jgi:hypothetical protein
MKPARHLSLYPSRGRRPLFPGAAATCGTAGEFQHATLRAFEATISRVTAIALGAATVGLRSFRDRPAGARDTAGKFKHAALRTFEAARRFATSRPAGAAGGDFRLRERLERERGSNDCQHRSHTQQQLRIHGQNPFFKRGTNPISGTNNVLDSTRNQGRKCLRDRSRNGGE